jgi:hypothetical protein
MIKKEYKPEKKKYWCPKCEKGLLNPGQVCGFCGHRLSPHIGSYKDEDGKNETS